MKTINTSIFDFPRLITEGHVYVDKTAQLYEFAKPKADSIYYLPRPRRFGKSLMFSTLKALFQGRRELFRGLAIEKTDWDWENEVYPVIHLDMSNASASTLVDFEDRLGKMMKFACEEFDVPYDSKVSAATNFLVLLESLPKVSIRRNEKSDGKYVLLIDEYDAPIAGLLDSDEGRAELPRIRKALHDFYVVAKAHCGDMRFLMVTGVSKFAKTSIFSAFNNPKDLSLDARAEVVSEEQHSLGRPDSVVKTEKAIYIVEFKYAKSAGAALAQCRERHYADAYATPTRRIRAASSTWGSTMIQRRAPSTKCEPRRCVSRDSRDWARLDLNCCKQAGGTR